MNRSTFFKSLGLALLSTPLLSFKNKSVEKDCLDFDLTHYKFTDDELTLDTVLSHGKYKNYYLDKNNVLPEGKLYYGRTVNEEGKLINEFWTLTNKDGKKYQQISHTLKSVSKKYQDYKTDISIEISRPIQ